MKYTDYDINYIIMGHTLLELKVPRGTFYGSLGYLYTGTPKRCYKEPFRGLWVASSNPLREQVSSLI